MSQKPFPIPVVPAASTEPPPQVDAETSSCASGEPYALMVLGDSMLPEFNEGEIIVIEPEGVARDGSYVIAFVNEEYIFRQLIQHAEGWMLKPLNPVYPNIPIDGLDVVKGVIILKKQPGKRSEQKAYA
ncbi:MAG: phage repressor protein [Hydrogenophilales bacterium 28-61-23]|nr:MAG: phage repressor protein [Hydrogenophilales bacterium 28-61-23]